MNKKAVQEEINTMKLEHAKLKKKQRGMSIISVLFFISLIGIPIAIIIFIFSILNARKMKKVDDDIKKFERDLRIAE